MTKIRTNQIAAGDATDGQFIKLVAGEWMPGDGGGGGSTGGSSAKQYSWIEDSYSIVADAAPFTAELLYVPIEYSVLVVLNGMVLLRDDDWSVYEDTGWKVDIGEVFDGDRLVIRYVVESIVLGLASYADGTTLTPLSPGVCAPWTATPMVAATRETLHPYVNDAGGSVTMGWTKEADAMGVVWGGVYLDGDGCYVAFGGGAAGSGVLTGSTTNAVPAGGVLVGAWFGEWNGSAYEVSHVFGSVFE